MDICRLALPTGRALSLPMVFPAVENVNQATILATILFPVRAFRTS